ncbi:hypothetical protein HAX54_050057, partial [Datura stramonium]|nr:hypothetical protein [Datura stramonium]
SLAAPDTISSGIVRFGAHPSRFHASTREAKSPSVEGGDEKLLQVLGYLSLHLSSLRAGGGANLGENGPSPEGDRGTAIRNTWFT